MTGSLGEQAAFYQRAFDRSPRAMVVYDAESLRILAVNDAAVELYGYARESFLRLTAADVRPERERARFLAFAAQRDPAQSYAAAGGVWIHQRRDGMEFEVEVAGTPSLDYGGRPAILATIVDVSERNRHYHLLKANQAALQAAQEHVNMGWFIIDLREGTFHLGGVLVRIYGRAEIPRANARVELERVWHPLELEEGERLLEAIDAREPYDGEFRLTVDGDLRWFHALVRVLRDADDQPFAMTGLAFDITAAKREADRLRRLAFTDAATGLPTYAAYVDQPATAPPTEAVLLVHADWQAARESLESPATHAARLAAVANALTGVVPPTSRLLHYADDTFAVILTRGARSRNPVPLAKRIVAAFERPVRCADADFLAGIKVGVGTGERRCDIGELTRRADAALRHAVRIGDGMAIHSAELDAANARRLTIERNLPHAVAERRLALAYQPIVSLSSGRIVGTEALLRWDCEGLGAVPPLEYIATAEESGAILRLGEWVLREACAQNRRWQRDGLGSIRIAVNVSARQVQQREFVRLVSSVLAATGHEPALLELELTEQAIMHRDGLAMRNLEAVRRLGVRIAVDDFGTGYSALSYLASLPLDALKLDRTFITPLGEDAFQGHVVASIVDLAHRRGLAVVGEGVETLAQLDALRTLGCDEMQGYLFARPTDSGAVAALLKRDRVSAALDAPIVMRDEQHL